MNPPGFSQVGFAHSRRHEIRLTAVLATKGDLPAAITRLEACVVWRRSEFIDDLDRMAADCEPEVSMVIASQDVSVSCGFCRGLTADKSPVTNREESSARLCTSIPTYHLFLPCTQHHTSGEEASSACGELSQNSIRKVPHADEIHRYLCWNAREILCRRM